MKDMQNENISYFKIYKSHKIESIFLKRLFFFKELMSGLEVFFPNNNV